jgi:hypothetical protein
MSHAAKPVVVRLALYKGRRTLLGLLVSLLTGSRYTAAELLVGRQLPSGWLCYGAARGEGVRKRRRVIDASEWDIFDLEGVTMASVKRWFHSRLGMPFSIRDELRMRFHRDGDDDIGRYHGAEAVAAALGFPEAATFTYGELAHIAENW